MSLHEAGIFGGTVSAVLFVISFLPMQARAARTRDLSSYSPGNLVIADLTHSLYVFSLHAGPLWSCAASTWSAPP